MMAGTWSVWLAASLSILGIDTRDTKMLSQPAVSAKHIAFTYADDIWICGLDGKDARRLTSDAGTETNPIFSPDGKWIAFSGQYDGNTDVYIVSIDGGEPKRLTWHPSPDAPRCFTPDGTKVLFCSPRNVFTRRFNQFYTVPLTGGFPEQLPIPCGTRASISPDGKFLAYTPLSERFEQWKNYRGGTHTRIWIYNFATHAVEQISQPEGRCNDTDPQWIGDATIAFRSDRAGEFNVFTFDLGSKQMAQATKFTDFPVVSMSAGGGNIVFEQAAGLHLMPAATSADRMQSQRLKIGVAADLVEPRSRYVKGSRYIRSAGISPSGARAVFEFRGEIVTVPAEKGDPRNLTNSPGANDRSPAWSPDGKTIAYFSDESGEYVLCLAHQDGKGEVRKIKLTGSGFYQRPSWSPDGKRLAFVDNSQTLYWLDVASGNATKVVSEPYFGQGGLGFNWSPDSKWLTYTIAGRSALSQVYVYSLADSKATKITDGMSDCTEPCFDLNGKYLYFFSSTDSGPVRHGFAQSSLDMRSRRAIYLTVLRKDQQSPFRKESDEEKGPAEASSSASSVSFDDDEKDAKEEKGARDKKGPDRGKGKMAGRTREKVEVKIDFEGIGQRIVSIPVPAGSYSGLSSGSANQFYYMSSAADGGRRGPGGGGELHRYDVERRRDESLITCSSFDLSPDGRKILYRAGDSWTIANTAGLSAGGGAAAAAAAPAGGPPGRRGGRGGGGDAPAVAATGGGRLNTDAIEVRVEPRQEWRQIFNEAWRINRDFFYAPNFHGADWNAMRTKYEPFIDHVATRNDLNRVIMWMCSELAVGHHRVGGGDSVRERRTVPGGLLGADYEIDQDRYRFKKVYGGLNWNPELRAPLTEPGVNVKKGEYLLAVQGKDLKAPTEIYSLFENTAGKAIEITVGPTVDGKNSRTVTVVPIDDEASLRNRDWIEGNVKKVHEATEGKVAYVYVPDTQAQGHEYFKRYFFPQVDKDAVIIDERFNAGGQIADYYIDILRRPFIANWAPRYGESWVTPGGAIFGPKVMLIDESAGSGGDLLPWMFHKFKIGPLVGKRTWGGLVGIGGYPVLMDGGTVTAPHFAIWTEDEGFTVENQGVPPDVEVEQYPADIIAGRDPQLEKAIELIKAELAKNPPKKAVRPAYPVRTKNPTDTGLAPPKAN